MKRFTKGALIIALVFTVIGFILCAVGAGIGFHYTSIPKMIREGAFEIGSNFGHWGKHWNNAWQWNEGDDDWESWSDDWESWSDARIENYGFTTDECADIKNLNLLVDCGIVDIQEAGHHQEINIEVKYRKESSKRNIKVFKDGNSLKIEENGLKNLANNDNVHITVQIPEDMEFQKVELQNSAGEVTVNHALHTKEFSVIVGAGECVIDEDLHVSGTVYAEVDAGEIDFKQISAGKIELHTGVGTIDVEKASADDVILNCGVGELNVTMHGSEEDYSYNIDCGVGEVDIDGTEYSGLGTTKKIRGGSKVMDIDCGVGEINVDFTK